MFSKKSFLLLSVMVVLALVIAACAPATPEPTPEPTEEPTEMMTEEPTEEPTPEPQTIVDIAVADGRFDTLVAALQAARLGHGLLIQIDLVPVQNDRDTRWRRPLHGLCSHG